MFKLGQELMIQSGCPEKRPKTRSEWKGVFYPGQMEPHRSIPSFNGSFNYTYKPLTQMDLLETEKL